MRVLIRWCHARELYFVRFAGIEFTFTSVEDAYEWAHSHGLGR